jgi:hypothetical protein
MKSEKVSGFFPKLTMSILIVSFGKVLGIDQKRTTIRDSRLTISLKKIGVD